MSTHPSPWVRAFAVPVVLVLAISLIVLAFLWPVLTSEPKGLPVVAAGPAAQVEQLAAAVEQNASGAVEITPVDDRDAAVAAIEHREAYGAIVLGTAPEVLTASAASPVAAQALGAIATGLQAQLQQVADAQAAQAGIDAPTVRVTVTDVVPLADTDPRGAGLASAVLPVTIGGILGGVLLSLAVPGRMRRLVALLTYAVVGGLALAGILQGWLGVLQGSYLANAAAIGLGVLAIGATVAGLGSLLGRAGLALGAVTFVLFAVPLASVATPVEFLPEPWGAVGQVFPPGAGATLLRELSYFPAADVTGPWLVLALWAIAGLALLVAGRARDLAAASASAPAA